MEKFKRDGRANIVLTMIVKNEADNIAEVIKAARQVCDGFCILDTGSTDGTQDLILEAVGDMPGELYVGEPFEDYSQAKNLSLMCAAALFPDAWALHLNGHEYVKVSRPPMVGDVITERLVEILDGREVGAIDVELTGYQGGSYDRPILIKLTPEVGTDQGWHFICPTHEWLTHPDRKPAPRTPCFTVHRSEPEGVDKRPRWRQDIELLLKQLLDDPSNERAQFYLGQSYDCLNEKLKAEHYYFACQNNPKAWKEHRFIAAIRRAQIFYNWKQEGCGDVAAWEAVAIDPERRAEALHEMINFARDLGNEHKAGSLEMIREGQPKPNRRLSLNHAAYRKSSPHVTEQRPPIKMLEGERRVLEDKMQGDYSPCNPSVLNLPDGRTLTAIRYVNYRTFGGKRYVPRDGSGTFRSEYLMRVSENVGLLSEEKLDNGLPGASIRGAGAIAGGWPQDTAVTFSAESTILGLEDLRLFHFRGQVWFTATCCQCLNFENTPQVVLGRLSPDFAHVEHLTRIKYAGAGRREKNWICFEWFDASAGKELLTDADAQLICIYSFSPFVVLEVDPDTGEAQEIRRQGGTFPAVDTAGALKGSCGPVRHEKKWQFLAHTTDNSRHHNVYTQRWVTVTDDLQLDSISDPFVLEHEGIEYPCGIRHVTGDQFEITYGYEDEQAKAILFHAGPA